MSAITDDKLIRTSSEDQFVTPPSSTDGEKLQERALRLFENLRNDITISVSSLINRIHSETPEQTSQKLESVSKRFSLLSVFQKNRSELDQASASNAPIATLVSSMNDLEDRNLKQSEVIEEFCFIAAKLKSLMLKISTLPSEMPERREEVIKIRMLLDSLYHTQHNFQMRFQGFILQGVHRALFKTIETELQILEEFYNVLTLPSKEKQIKTEELILLRLQTLHQLLSEDNETLPIFDFSLFNEHTGLQGAFIANQQKIISYSQFNVSICAIIDTIEQGLSIDRYKTCKLSLDIINMLKLNDMYFSNEILPVKTPYAKKYGMRVVSQDKHPLRHFEWLQAAEIRAYGNLGHIIAKILKEDYLSKKLTEKELEVYGYWIKLSQFQLRDFKSVHEKDKEALEILQQTKSTPTKIMGQTFWIERVDKALERIHEVNINGSDLGIIYPYLTKSPDDIRNIVHYHIENQIKQIEKRSTLLQQHCAKLNEIYVLIRAVIDGQNQILKTPEQTQFALRDIHAVMNERDVEKFCLKADHFIQNNGAEMIAMQDSYTLNSLKAHLTTFSWTMDYKETAAELEKELQELQNLKENLQLFLIQP